MRIFPLAAAAAALLLYSCTQRPTAPATNHEIKTIGNTPITSIPVQPPQTLDDVVAPTDTADNEAKMKPVGPAATETTGTRPPMRADELSRKMNLPFAPAIAMDPVDGGKVSITSDTPIVEYKNRLYYFGSVKNRQAFMSNPEAFLKERLAAY